MLLAYPYQYKDIVLQLGLIIADGPLKLKLFDRPLKNLTVQDVTALYAANGITFAMANDAYSYALQWLKDFIVCHPSQVAPITTLLEASQEAVEYLDCPIPGSMVPPPDKWDPSMLPCDTHCSPAV
jgi:hypothetical protein